MLRLLLIADTHVGLDLPLRPRVDRPRRGREVLAAFRRALAPARRGEVALVVHGGDLLNRSRPPAEIVRLALEPLLEVADGGVPVVMVPGNHERSSLPLPMLALHPNLHVLEVPRTVRLELGGLKVAVGGLPCVRTDARRRVRPMLDASGLLEAAADIRIAVLHQVVEGAVVGPSGFTFRRGADVVAGRSIPPGLAAVLCGHIHRQQSLTRDLRGRSLAAPVIYPGSIDRMSFAERFEPKGYVVVDLEPGPGGGRLAAVEFTELPVRPMEVVSVEVTGLTGDQIRQRIVEMALCLPSDSVVQVRLGGTLAPDAWPALGAGRLRALLPPTMILELRPPRSGALTRGWRGKRAATRGTS